MAILSLAARVLKTSSSLLKIACTFSSRKGKDLLNTVLRCQVVSDSLAGRFFSTSSNTLAWKIPWMEEPGRLQSRGLRRVGHD